MIVDIQTRRLRTIEQLRAFVEGNEAVDFQPRDRGEAYGFARATLERFGYRRLGKRDKGAVLRFLVAATGISRQQMERLVRRWRDTGAIRDRRGGWNRRWTIWFGEVCRRRKHRDGFSIVTDRLDRDAPKRDANIQTGGIISLTTNSASLKRICCSPWLESGSSTATIRWPHTTPTRHPTRALR